MRAAAFVGALLVATATVLAEEKYSSKFDNINVAEILSNDRLLNNYAACLLEDGDAKCNPTAKDVKKILAEALVTDCAKCTDKQRMLGRQAMSFLMEKKPELWQKLSAKYDPSGEYTKRFNSRT